MTVDWLMTANGVVSLDSTGKENLLAGGAGHGQRRTPGAGNCIQTQCNT